MSWPSLQTFFVVIVTTVAANQQGALCDCASQGPWQPLFKPSQILHSEFPEHKHSSSTGGPKPTKYEVKLVPHLVVPIVNPLAFSIHHGNDNHIQGDNYKYKTKLKYGKAKIKEVHYHYNYPHPDEQNSSTLKHSDPSPSSTPISDNNLHSYPEDDNNHYTNIDGYPHDDHYQVSQENDGTPNENVPTGNGLEEGHHPDENSQENHYSREEEDVNKPYYTSEENNDAAYDASKLSPIYEKYPHYENMKQDKPPTKFYENYLKNEFNMKEKYRGKSILFPLNQGNYQNYETVKIPPTNPIIYKPQSLDGEGKTNHKGLILPTRTAIPTVLKPYHHPPQPLPINHPPLTFYNPWRIFAREEARRMAEMRPPAPGLPDTWSTIIPDQGSVVPSKVKMTSVIYPIKTFQH